MNEFLKLFRGALTLDNQTFLDLKTSPDVFRKGFVFLVIIGLIVGLVAGIIGIVNGLVSNPTASIAQVQAEAEQSMKLFLDTMPPVAREQFLENYRMGMRIAEHVIRDAKSPLPQPVGVVFKNAGAIISYPFGWLGSLLFYGVLVQVCAKLLGGRGTIAQMWGLSSLAVAPHILDVLSAPLGLVPLAGGCISSLVGLVASVWGAAIYVKGTAVAHEMSGGKALVAVLLPVIVSIVLGFLVASVLILLIVTSSAGQ